MTRPSYSGGSGQGLDGSPNGSVQLAAMMEVKQRVADRLSAYAEDRESAGLAKQTPAQRRELAEQLLSEEVAEQSKAELAAGRQVLGPNVAARVSQMVLDELFGIGVLERLLADPEIENISVNGCDNVWLRYAGRKKVRGPAVAASDDELVEKIRLLAARSGVEERRFDRASPRLNLQLPDGSRMIAIMSVCDRVSLSIRRHRFPAANLADLVGLGVCDALLADFLGAMVRGRKNVLIAGGMDIGKTTALRALASEILPDERLVTIEDTFELGLDTNLEAHPDVVAMQAREANIEGVGAIEQAELVRWGLRMAADRVIVGEIRGAEVVPMCNAMSQGNDGSMSTIHASTSRGVFHKLAAYAAQAPERLTLEATNLLVASAVHFVVHLGRDTHKVRCITSVREVIDADGAQVVSNEVFAPGPDRRAIPSVPLRTETAEQLAEAGFDPSRLAERRWGR